MTKIKTYAQRLAIERENKKRLLKLNPNLTEKSGIYFLYRKENGIKFGYVGQAKHILTRLSQHLVGYQHIDISLKKHGLYDEEKNPSGYMVAFTYCSEDELDQKEQEYIIKAANLGYQLRNKNRGGQGEGKEKIDDYNQRAGYQRGKEKGYREAREEIAKLFEKNLIYSISGNPTKLKERALEKFEFFIGKRGDKNEES